MNTLKKVTALIDLFSLDAHSRKMKNHLRKTGAKASNTDQNILVEFGQPPDNLIALSIFLPRLREEFDSNTSSYWMTKKTNISALTRPLKFFFSVSRELMGNEITILPTSKTKRRKIRDTFSAEIASIYTKQDLLELRIHGVRIGDLVYDKYLSDYHEKTVELTDKRFETVLLDCIYFTDAWVKLFKEMRIKAVVVSHSVYHFGIPSRVAIHHGIEAFEVNAHAIYRLTSEFPLAYTDERTFPHEFTKIPHPIAEKGLALARNKLSSRFRGEILDDLPYMTTSAFSSDDNFQFSTNNLSRQKKVVLVAMHDFYDSPHVYGDHFYEDFYEWLIRLGELSQETDYEWLIKTHPFVRGNGREILESFVKENSNFRLLPLEITHNEIIKNGIDLVLTVYGTIAMEYAALGIKVLNASKNNPHASFNFSITPNSKVEYEEILKNFPQLKFEIDTSQIYQYYFMKHIYHMKTWVYKDYSKYLKETNIGTLDKASYSYFLEGNNSRNRVSCDLAITKFINSDDIRLNRVHFDDFSYGLTESDDF